MCMWGWIFFPSFSSLPQPLSLFSLVWFFGERVDYWTSIISMGDWTLIFFIAWYKLLNSWDFYLKNIWVIWNVFVWNIIFWFLVYVCWNIFTERSFTLFSLADVNNFSQMKIKIMLFIILSVFSIRLCFAVFMFSQTRTVAANKNN